MGFTKRRLKFTAIFNVVIQSEPWFELTHNEQLIYIHLKSNFDGSNNGEIRFTYSQIQRKKGDNGKSKGRFSSATIANALKGLERKGWIERAKIGGMYRYYNLYKLTLTYDKVLEGKRRKKPRGLWLNINKTLPNEMSVAK